VPRLSVRRDVAERMHVSGIVQVQVRRAAARQDVAVAYHNA
jgi:hypothetical protein